MTTDAIVPRSNHMLFWIGQLNKEELKSYLDEPGSRFDGEPQSNFAKDLGRFYDHDFLWAHASLPAGSIQELALRMGIQDKILIEEMNKRLSADELVTCFVILWNYRVVNSLTQTFAGGKLKFIDSWDFPSPYTDDF